MFEINAKLSYIRISDFKENIKINFNYWSFEQYKKQWCTTCLKIFEKSHSKWAFILNMDEPKNINFLELWVIYRLNEKIFIQNELLFFESLDEEFNINHMEKYINDRSANNGYINDDGIYEEVSEWQCSLDDIKAFYKSICE